MRNRRFAVIKPRRFFNDDFFPAFDEMSDYSSSIAVDLYEDDDNVVAKFNNISGFDENEIDISIEDNVLTVSGEKKEEEEKKEKKRKYYRKEIHCESFSRSIALPIKVTPKDAEAELKKGILTIKMPKAEEVKPKKISIKATGK